MIVLNQWPASLAASPQPRRVKKSVGAYTPGLLNEVRMSPRLRAAFPVYCRPRGNETAKSYLQASPNARGLNEQEVHTRSWHHMHEWLEQYYDLLSLFPSAYSFVFSFSGI